MASLLKWVGNAARDLVDANTDDDRKRRLAQGRPALYQQPRALTKVGGFVRPALDAGIQQARVVKDVAEVPSALAQSIAAMATANKVAQFNAQQNANEGFTGARQALQAVPRQLIQLGSSVNPVGGDVYDRITTQTTPLGKFIAGAEPVPTMQRQYKTTSEEKGGDYAKGEAALTALFDAALLKGGAKKTASVVEGLKKPDAPVAVAPETLAPAPLRGERLPDMSGALNTEPAFLRVPAQTRYKAAQSVARDFEVPAYQKQAQSLIDRVRLDQVAKATPETPEPIGLLAPPTGVAQGRGFTMTPKPNPEIIKIGNQISKIDRQLEQVRLGKSTKSAGEVRALMQQREGLVTSVDNPPTPSTTKPVVKPPAKLPPPKTAPVSKTQWKKIVKEESKPTPTVTLPEAKLPTGIPKGPNVPQKMFASTRGELSRMGTGGAEIANRLKVARDKSEVAQQAFLDSVPTVQKLGKKEFPDFVDSLDALSRGEKPNMSPKVAQAVTEWSQNIPKVLEQARATGKDVGNRGPYYFPRQYSELLKTRNGFNQAVNHLVESGQAASKAEAIQQMQFVKSGKSFGKFKEREFDIPGYDKSPDAVTSYVGGAFDDIFKSEQFGPKNEIGSQLLARIAEEGYDAGRAGKTFNIALENVDKSSIGNKISGKVRQVNALRSLGTAGVSNATQLPVNVGTIAGIGQTVKGGFKALTNKQARLEAKQSGVLLESSMNKLAKQGLGTSGKITRNVAAPFFRQIENFNRRATAIVGQDWGNSLAAKAAKGNAKSEAILRDKLGVTGPIGPKLTRAQEIQASRALVEKAQFKVDPQDLPGWVDSPMGKAAAQFRSFGYKQSEFMFNEVLREAMKGNVKPLARFVAVGVPAGAASQFVKSTIKGSKYTTDDENPVSQGAKALAAVGAGGLPGSELQNMYKSAQYDNLDSAIAGSVGGPTVSFGFETAKNVNKTLGGNWKPLAKQGIRSIPAVGSPIANRVLKSDYQKKEDAKQVAKDNGEVVNMNYDEFKASGKENQLVQLDNGDYAIKVGDDVKTSENLKGIYTAINKKELNDSGMAYKVVGDTVYRQNKDGEVTPTPKIQFDNQINTATLTQQKRNEDYEGWAKTAEKQLENINEQLKDPSLDPLEAIKLQNQADSLMEQYEKYASYGGAFKKGGSGGGRGGRGGSNGVIASSFKTAGKGSVARPKTVSVKKLSPGKLQKTRKLSVAKLPQVRG